MCLHTCRNTRTCLALLFACTILPVSDDMEAARRPRVSAPGIRIHGDGAARQLRWWELPMEDLREAPRLASPRTPRTNDLTGVISKVDCHRRPKLRGIEAGDSNANSHDRKAWAEEYLRLSLYLESAYATEAGLEHDDAEYYDDKTKVGQLLAHFDHDADAKKNQLRKARRDARRAAQLDGSTTLARHLTHAEDAEDVAEEQRLLHERAKADERTVARRGDVARLSRRLGQTESVTDLGRIWPTAHPFSTLRATSNVGTWWPIHTHAKPVWGGNDPGPVTVSTIVRV